MLLIGQPGGGKSTLGRELARALPGRFLSAGELLRIESRGNTSRALSIAGQLARGEGVAPEIPYALLAERLRSLERGKPLILDGFPRRSDQIELLESTLGRPPSHVLLLDAPTAIVTARIMSRLICEGCERSYGPTVPPARENQCDDCGLMLNRRSDDEPEGLRRRHSFWQRNGPAIVGRYAEANLLREIDASRAPDVVLAFALHEIDE